MKNKNKTSVLRGMNNIRECYILESEIPHVADVVVEQGEQRATRHTLRSFTSGGWFAAAVCAIVAFGTLGGIIMAGRLVDDPTPVPPAGTVAPDNTVMEQTEPVSETESKAENKIPYTVGLDFASVEDEEGYCYVAGIGTATDKVLRIPETSPDGLIVKYIGSKAFMGNTHITEVVLPDTVVSIQTYAFEECSNLKKVTLGSHFEEVMPRAFFKCTKLSDINLTHDHAVWTYAMSYTLWMEEQTDEFMIYGGHLIGYIGNGGDVVIPDGVVYIEGGAFDYNDRITSVTVPDGCERITSGAFSHCTSLLQVTLPSSLWHIDSTAFWGCTSLRSIEMPGVKTIAYRTFYGCTSLTHVDIPSVTAIYGNAFEGCVSLSSVTSTDNLTFALDNAFKNTSLTELILSINTNRLGASAFSGCSELTRVETYATVIDSNCFENCQSLREIMLHDGVQTLGSDIFRDCTALERITIPTTVTEIGSITAIPSENLVIEYAGTAEDWASIQMDEQTAALLLSYVQFTIDQ